MGVATRAFPPKGPPESARPLMCAFSTFHATVDDPIRCGFAHNMTCRCVLVSLCLCVGGAYSATREGHPGIVRALLKRAGSGKPRALSAVRASSSSQPIVTTDKVGGGDKGAAREGGSDEGSGVYLSRSPRP